MAHITTDEVKVMRNQIKALYPNIKVSVVREHYSSVKCSIMESDINFGVEYKQVNTFYLKDSYKSDALALLQAINSILHQGHYDKSDAMIDYFDCAWYVHLEIGKWDKPYIYKESALPKEITELLPA